MAGLDILDKIRHKVAQATGLDDVYSASNVAEQYYPDELHNGRGDAMRHMLASAIATQKYGRIPAAVLGYANEAFSLDPIIESGMDNYNNALGRDFGAQYPDRQQLISHIYDAIEAQKAKTLSGYYKNYAKGGLVGCDCHKFAQGGIVPSANGFMTGGLNLINPQSTGNGPLNVQWNTNNMLQSARSGR